MYNTHHLLAFILDGANDGTEAFEALAYDVLIVGLCGPNALEVEIVKQNGQLFHSCGEYCKTRKEWKFLINKT